MVGIVGESERRQVVASAREVRGALEPCNREWLKKRLSAMALAFGHERDPDRATAWLAETGRLLLDLPQDILAHAIDEAIKRSDRGFMPAVGQIRAIADPLAAERRQQAARLDAMAAIIVGSAGRATAVVRPWDRGAAPSREPAEDLIPPAEIATFNRNMRKFGCAMRCGVDGRTFLLSVGAADPTLAEEPTP